MTGDPDYEAELGAIAPPLPLVSKPLQDAQRQRAQRLGSPSALVRLKGLEQLYAYLIAERGAYRENQDLQPLAFLIDRLFADFETGLEATLSGYPGVCADAMRDVMETEALLLDFAHAWENAREWLQGDDKVRRQKYAPAAVRKRLQAAGIAPYSNPDWDARDYRGHSEALHVTPSTPFGIARGFHAFDDSVFGQVGYMEIFEHSLRVLDALDRLRLARSSDVSAPRLPLAMDDYFRAGQLTKTNESLVIGVLRVIHEKEKPEPGGDVPRP